MSKFSQDSFSKLLTCHPDLQALFYDVIKYYDCIILEGRRNQINQERAFANGTTKLHYPHSKHNQSYSMAVDVAPFPIDFSNQKLAIWFGGYVLGIAQKLKDVGKMTHSVRWGGAWDGLGKLDKPGELSDASHFELIS